MNKHSVQGKEWVLKHFDKNLAEIISKEFDIDFLTSRLLAIRNINQDQIESFLNPKIKNFLPNPFHFKDMDLGLSVVSTHIKNKSKICIFGDYDVDGLRGVVAFPAILSVAASFSSLEHDAFGS